MALALLRWDELEWIVGGLFGRVGPPPVDSGSLQAELKSDGSNRAAAQKTALQAALSDIEAQAEVIASATGLSISGVLSVSASVSNYGPVPYALAVPERRPPPGSRQRSSLTPRCRRC